MIPAARVEDQELAVAAERSRIDHRSFAWCRHLRAGATGDPKSFLGAAQAIGSAEVANLHAVDRQRQSALGRREGDRRSQSPRILQRSEIGANLLALLRSRRGA